MLYLHDDLPICKQRFKNPSCKTAEIWTSKKVKITQNGCLFCALFSPCSAACFSSCFLVFARIALSLAYFTSEVTQFSSIELYCQLLFQSRSSSIFKKSFVFFSASMYLCFQYPALKNPLTTVPPAPHAAHSFIFIIEPQIVNETHTETTYYIYADRVIMCSSDARIIN